jgi:hypothetical protein
MELNAGVHHGLAQQGVMALLFAEGAVFRADEGVGLLVHSRGGFHPGHNGRGGADVAGGRHDDIVAGVADERPGGDGAHAGDKGDRGTGGFQDVLGDVDGGVHAATGGIDHEDESCGAFGFSDRALDDDGDAVIDLGVDGHTTTKPPSAGGLSDAGSWAWAVKPAKRNTAQYKAARIMRSDLSWAGQSPAMLLISIHRNAFLYSTMQRQ